MMTNLVFTVGGQTLELAWPWLGLGCSATGVGHLDRSITRFLCCDQRAFGQTHARFQTPPERGLPTARSGAESPPMNQTQKCFARNRVGSRNQIPISNHEPLAARHGGIARRLTDGQGQVITSLLG